MPIQILLYGMTLVLIVAFVWSWIATSEIYMIARGNPAQAALWGAANSALGFTITFIIAATLAFAFIFPYVLGSTLATYLVLQRRSRG